MSASVDFRSIETFGKFLMPYALRRVPQEQISGTKPLASPPNVGDMALARVISIGRSDRIELVNGRLASIHAGSLIAVTFGHRYATSQYEAVAKTDGDHCDLLTAAGVSGLVISRKETTRPPTKLMVIGNLCDYSGRVLNLNDFKIVGPEKIGTAPSVVVCGSSMNSGKTHTASAIIRSFTDNGYSVGAAKITGTAAGRDIWNFMDAGAIRALDFTDYGYPSTVGCSQDELFNIYQSARNRLVGSGADKLVFEIADGVLQRETSLMLRDRRITSSVSDFVYCASDPLAILGGIGQLRNIGIEPAAVSGLVSRSPLAIEESEAATGLRCVKPEHLFAEVLMDHHVQTAS